MIRWIKRRSWIKRAMKELPKSSREYKLLNAMQYAIKVLVNCEYGG